MDVVENEITKKNIVSEIKILFVLIAFKLDFWYIFGFTYDLLGSSIFEQWH